jgi:transmembrane sensor
MTKKNAKELLLKYQAGTATEEEKVDVEKWMLTDAYGDFDLNDDELLNDLMEIRQRLAIDQPQRKVIRLWPRIAAAAAILIFLSVGLYFYLHKTGPSQFIANNYKNDIAPGGNKAILTLANGKQIALNDAKNGKLADQGDAAINKTADGEIIYSLNQVSPDLSSTEYNTMTTPQGGQYHVTLSDGTNVWLNAASSIRYPTTFNGNDRKVEITGEAYFEVAHNAAKPFKVTSNGQTVEVLGTHFNINAYKDEPTLKTTLFKGSVKVIKGQVSVTLKPGQQSVIIDNGYHSSLNVLNDVNTDRVLAWKNGKFSFDNADIKTVMRQIGRWYNIEIQYEGEVQSTVFSGEIYRNVNLSKALEILGFTKVNFRIEGRKIIITP